METAQQLRTTATISTGPDPRPPGPDPRPARPHRRRRQVLVGVAVVMVLVVATGLWLTFGGDKAQQGSYDEARQRVGSTVVAPTVAPDAGPLTAAPAPGVYRFTGSGQEHTSFPPLTEEQGPAMPATVTQRPDGCWEFRIDYNTHHWQAWTYCTAEGQMHEHGGSSYSRRAFGSIDVENTTTFTCDPLPLVLTAADQPGASRSRSCSGSGTVLTTPVTSTGTMTVVGTEAVEVGGERVPAVRVRYDLRYSGAQSGTETSEFWFASSTGMPLKAERHFDVGTETPFGQISYNEDGAFTLQERQPV